jgi:hypothetical protein
MSFSIPGQQTTIPNNNSSNQNFHSEPEMTLQINQAAQNFVSTPQPQIAANFKNVDFY